MAQALLIVDHGSRKPDANRMLESVAGLVRRQRPDLIVNIAHMELAEPTLQQGIASCADEGAAEIVVHPYMLSPGRHATDDIPNMVEIASREYPDIIFRVTDPLGIHDKIGEVILERAEL